MELAHFRAPKQLTGENGFPSGATAKIVLVRDSDTSGEQPPYLHAFLTESWELFVNPESF